VLDRARLWKKSDVSFLTIHRQQLHKKHIKDRTWDKDSRLYDAEENIWNKWDELTEKWRKIQKEELHDLYSSQNIIRVIKLRSMR